MAPNIDAREIVDSLGDNQLIEQAFQQIWTSCDSALRNTSSPGSSAESRTVVPDEFSYPDLFFEAVSCIQEETQFLETRNRDIDRDGETLEQLANRGATSSVDRNQNNVVASISSLATEATQITDNRSQANNNQLPALSETSKAA